MPPVSLLSPLGKRIYDLVLELVAIPSITGSEGGEERCADFISAQLARLDYFKENPKDLKRGRLQNDPLGRSFVWALLRSARPSKKTVILTGHIDVVDIDVYGPLRSWAFDPEEYTRRIGQLDLPEPARCDLESGNYLFGRGVADMKAGIALNICLLEDYAASRAELDFNVLLLAVPDEEGDSHGMRGAIPSLVEAQREDGLEYLACINTEPAFESGGPAIYFGTIGKIMPLYLCVGRESHVGEYYQGLNSTLLASYLNIALDGTAESAETYGKQTFPPQCCLRMRDLRDRYAVTLPERCAVYYNCLTVSKTPLALLNEMKEKAEFALRSVFAHLGRQNERVRVLTVEELMRKAALKSGDSVEAVVSRLLPSIRSEDERDRNIDFLASLLDYLGEKGPMVVVGFVPPFYPPRRNRGESSYELAVRSAARSASELLRARGRDLEEIEIFQGITDLSYTGFQGTEEEMLPLISNTPLWGKGYGLPVEMLQEIDIPCVLLGPIGRDAHKNTERLELDYSLNILPGVLKSFISSLVERVGCCPE